ncbi:MAG: ArsR/SmtB family transcription factor [Myxococcota bacterium]
MAPPVVHPSEPTVERAVALLATMAHPARLAVLSWLHRRGPTSVGELVEGLGVEQTAMSHHLRLLRDARLVEAERRGKRVVYRLDDAHVGAIVEDALRHAGETPAG